MKRKKKKPEKKGPWFAPDRAVSLRQPWPGLLAQGHIDIVFMRRSTRFRGPVTIHISRIPTGQQYVLDDIGEIDPVVMASHGGIIAEAELVDVIRYKFREDYRRDRLRHRLSMDQFRVGKYGWVFANVRQIPFRPVNGNKGFFRFEKE